MLINFCMQPMSRQSIAKYGEVRIDRILELIT